MSKVELRIENSLTLHNDMKENEAMLLDFNQILTVISTAPSITQLKIDMGNIFLSPITESYFKFGFGSNHMWLKQRSLNSPTRKEVRVDTEQRILIAEF